MGVTPTNNRVTNAILLTKIDAMHEDVKGISARLDAHDTRIRTLEQEQAKQGRVPFLSQFSSQVLAKQR